MLIYCFSFPLNLPLTTAVWCCHLDRCCISGYGYADVENNVKCRPETVMRVASVGKTFTMAIAAKLMQKQRLDLDKDVAEYVETWPQKSYDGKKVTGSQGEIVLKFVYRDKIIML